MVRKSIAACFSAIGGRYFRESRWKRFVVGQSRRLANQSRRSGEECLCVLVQVRRKDNGAAGAGFYCSVDAQTRAVMGCFSMSEARSEPMFNIAVLSCAIDGECSVVVCHSGVSRKNAEQIFVSSLSEWADGPSEVFSWWRQTVSEATLG